MRLRRLYREDDAVSPVIGVVLLVGITVILAAVVGTFALGLGDRTGAAPTASFDFEKNEMSTYPDELEITHDGGDDIRNTELFVSANVRVQDEDGSPGPTDRLSWYEIAQDDGATEGERVSAGDSILVETPNSDPELEDKTFRVTWERDDRSATLATWRGEDA